MTDSIHDERSGEVRAIVAIEVTDALLAPADAIPSPRQRALVLDDGSVVPVPELPNFKPSRGLIPTNWVEVWRAERKIVFEPGVGPRLEPYGRVVRVRYDDGRTLEIP